MAVMAEHEQDYCTAGKVISCKVVAYRITSQPTTPHHSRLVYITGKPYQRTASLFFELPTVSTVEAFDECLISGCAAAVVWAFGSKPVIEQIDVAPPQAGEVRIRITHTSICQSDLNAWRNENLGHLYPRIFGHEASGIVESVGEGVTDVRPGDHVLPLFTGECKQCVLCKSPKTNLCGRFNVNPLRGTMLSDNTSRFSKDGKSIFHCYGSTFSEFTVVEKEYVVKINQEAELDKVLLLSCGASTGLGSVWNVAKVEANSTIAIFGLGSVGCSIAEGARVAGASRIIGVDINPAKFEKGKVFGVTDFVNPDTCENPVDQVIREMTQGGVDYSFECVGNSKLMKVAFDSCNPYWGVTVVAGVPSSRAVLMELSPSALLLGKTLKGTLYGGWRPSDIPTLVERFMNKEFQVDALVSHKFPLSSFAQAFQLLLDGESLRSVIYMQNFVENPNLPSSV